MIDNMRLSKRNLTDNEAKNIIKKSYLQTMYEPKTGRIFYATGSERHIHGGLFIKIDIFLLYCFFLFIVIVFVIFMSFVNLNQISFLRIIFV